MKKKTVLFLAFLAFAQFSFAQDTKFQLSTHILDIKAGKPAENVKITLSKKSSKEKWEIIDEKNTDNNGRIKDFLKYNKKDNSGIYKLTFHTSSYFKAINQKTFYPFIEVVFELADNQHYHVPITLSPFGYSTYRGN